MGYFMKERPTILNEFAQTQLTKAIDGINKEVPGFVNDFVHQPDFSNNLSSFLTKELTKYLPGGYDVTAITNNIVSEVVNQISNQMSNSNELKIPYIDIDWDQALIQSSLINKYGIIMFNVGIGVIAALGASLVISGVTYLFVRKKIKK